MEQFIVSARKYRPQNFEDVVGQKAITDTLKKAIEQNHLAQSLLFTGPRGIGKTTCARILAKKINEQETQDQDQEQDFAFNIFELDAASNNSVDDIRNLNDQVRIPPQTGKYKVYIIDEVHMLSSGAFNAFLKTLEEPPKHVIFILATTEKHKIIPTILSRCQIFDFTRISVNDIKNHLKNVAALENIEADDNALHLIAEHADGALRDALSTFDRMVSFCGNELKREEVSQNLNILDFKTYFEMTDYLAQQDLKNALLLLDKLLAKGYDGHHFISGLASHFRDILVAQNTETVKLLEVSEDAKQEYIRQSKSLSADFLIKSINIANECDYKYKSSYNQRITLELALMNIIKYQQDSSPEKKKVNENSNYQSKSKPLNKNSASAKESVDTRKDDIPKVNEPTQKTHANFFPADQLVNKKQIPTQVDQSKAQQKTEIGNKKSENQTSEVHKTDNESPETETADNLTPQTKQSESQQKETEPEENPGNQHQEKPIDEKEVSSNSQQDTKAVYHKQNDRLENKAQENNSGSSSSTLNEPEEPIRKRVAGLSIKSIHQKKKVQSEHAKKNVPKREMDEAFTEDQVIKYWQEYSEIVKSAGKRNLSAILNACEIELQEKELQVNLPAQGMKEDLQREQDKLLNYLRKNLKNTHIKLHINVKRTEEKTLVTTREKYDKLVEINPKVEVLRQKFNLEL